MSRFARENPDDYEAAWDRLVDKADQDRKRAKEEAPTAQAPQVPTDAEVEQIRKRHEQRGYGLVDASLCPGETTAAMLNEAYDDTATLLRALDAEREAKEKAEAEAAVLLEQYIELRAKFNRGGGMWPEEALKWAKELAEEMKVPLAQALRARLERMEKALEPFSKITRSAFYSGTSHDEGYIGMLHDSKVCPPEFRWSDVRAAKAALTGDGGVG